MLDFNRVWLPFFYLYGVGGLIFIIGMYIAIQSKSIKKERERHKKWFYVLLFGMIYYIGIHSFFTLAAIDNMKLAFIILFIIILIALRLVFFVFNKQKKYT